MFTSTYIQSLSPSKQGKEVVFDPELPGFGVRVYPSGRKVWYAQWNRNGRQGSKTFGSVEIIPQAKARAEAKKLLAQVLLGEHQERPSSMTFGDFADTYMERHAIRNKRSWREDERRLQKYLLPQLGKYKLDLITRADIARVVADVGGKYPIQANRVREQLSKMFELAIGWGFLPDDARNPVKGVPDYSKEVVRQRWLLPEEIKALSVAIREESLFVQGAIKLYLMTGLRKRELLRLKWSDVDLEYSFLIVQGRLTKNGKPLCLPLAGEALKVLLGLPRHLDNLHLFPGEGEDGHLVGIDKIWQRIRKRAGLDDVELHDLRKTAGSMMVQSGQSLHVVGAVLNHSSAEVTAKHYGFLTTKETKAALEEHGARIASLLEVS